MSMTMSLITACLLCFKIILLMIIETMGLVINCCQIFTSFVKEEVKQFLRKVRHRIFAETKLVSLLLLKCIIDVTTGIQNIILKICDFLALNSLNSKEKSTFRDNCIRPETSFEHLNKTVGSDSPEYGVIEVSHEAKRYHFFQNWQHFTQPDIIISNLKYDSRVILEINPNEIITDKQSMNYFEDSYPQSLKNCSINNKIPLSGAENAYHGFNKDFNEFGEAVSHAVKCSQKSSLTTEKSNTINNEYTNASDHVDLIEDDFSLPKKLKSSSFIENTNYHLEKSIDTGEFPCPSNSSISAKQVLLEDKSKDLDGNLKQVVNEEKSFRRCECHSFGKGKLKPDVSKNAIELLRRHKLISDDGSSSDDSSQRNGNCDSMFETFTTSLVDEIERNCQNAENSFASDFNGNCAEKKDNSDYLLNPSLKYHFEGDDANFCHFSKSIKFDEENKNSRVWETDTTKSAVIKEPVARSVTNKQTDTETFPLKENISTLHCNNRDNDIFEGSTNKMNFDFKRELSPELISDKLFKTEVNNQSASSIRDDEYEDTFEPIAYKLLSAAQIENGLDSIHPKVNGVVNFLERNYKTSKSAGEQFQVNFKLSEAKASNGVTRDLETGGRVFLTNRGTSKMISKNQMTTSRNKALHNSIMSVTPQVDEIASDNTHCSVCRNKLDITPSSYINDLLLSDEKNSKNVKDTMIDNISKLSCIFCHQASNEQETDTKDTDIIEADECFKFLRILQFIFPDEKFQLNTEVAFKNNFKRSELTKIFYKNKLNEIDNKISRMLDTFDDLKSMTVDEHDAAMKQMFETTNYSQNDEKMFECANLYLLGPIHTEGLATKLEDFPYF